MAAAASLKRRSDATSTDLGLARDPRSLGVALRRVTVRQGTRFVVLKADDARFADGFHSHEPTAALRWTNGYAAPAARDLRRIHRRPGDRRRPSIRWG